MNRLIPTIKKLAFFILLFSGSAAFCQDIKTVQLPDSLFLLSAGTISFRHADLFLYHFPDVKDEKTIKKYGYLLKQKPSSVNYEQYYQLACSFWKMDSLAEAELLFSTILHSDEKHYSTVYKHSSDIPGDATTNIYGYGSYTSSYKNSAAIYLAKIHIEKKEFEKAFNYLEDATQKYKVSYSCGTGANMQQEEYDYLYAYCYEGLNKPRLLLELLLPNAFSRNEQLIAGAIRKLYTPAEINRFLSIAENSMECSFDSFPSNAYITQYATGKKARTDTLTYYNGTATIQLFGKKIQLPSPDLKDGEHATSEHFIKVLKESELYLELVKSAVTVVSALSDDAVKP